MFSLATLDQTTFTSRINILPLPISSSGLNCYHTYWTYILQDNHSIGNCCFSLLFRCRLLLKKNEGNIRRNQKIFIKQDQRYLWSYARCKNQKFAAPKISRSPDPQNRTKIWWESGKILVRIWWESGENLVRFWWESGETLVRLWWDSGETLVRIWWESDENLMRIWWESGENRVRIWW